MKGLISFTFLIFISFFKPVLYAAPIVGEIAPPIQLTGLLQATGKTADNIKSLKGKVVVLEFWATWCAPCIGAMPHLNELSKKYKNKNVQFISVTDESREKVSSFLKKRTIDGWVGLDERKSMLNLYEVDNLPFTVVIGSSGRILGYPASNTLSEDLLDRALAGQILKQPNEIEPPVLTMPVVAGLTDPIYELSIRPSDKGMSSRFFPSSYKASGVSALNIIQVAFDAELSYTELQTALPQRRFDVVATNLSKKSPDWSWREQLKQMVQDVWQFSVVQEKEITDVFELTASPGINNRLKKADPDETYSKQGSDDGILVGRNTSIDVLCKTLQDALGRPVLNATNLPGNYDYNLYFEEDKPKTLQKAIEEEMGLKLRRAKRAIDVIRIVPKDR